MNADGGPSLMIRNPASVAPALIVGATLPGAGIPRTIAAIAMIPGDPILREINIVKPKRRTIGHIRHWPTGGPWPMMANMALEAISSMPAMHAIWPQLHGSTGAKGSG